MHPYPGLNADKEECVYNYRHSRKCRVIEMVFGISTSRYIIFQRPIIATASNVEKCILTCLKLHNYSRKTVNLFYSSSGFINSEDDCGTIIPEFGAQALLNIY